MSLSSLLLFAGVYLAAVATPGPGVAALVARVMGHGLKGVAPFIAGYVAGDLVWFLFASTGLAVLAREFAGLLFAVKIAGAFYLLYVAWGLLKAPGQIAPEAPPPAATSGWRAFVASFSLTIGNPKVIVFFLSILPLALDLDRLDLVNLAIVACLAAAILTAVLASYALAADRLRGWLGATPAVKFVRRATAGLMAGAAVAILAR
jgi:threonine/homoserine/homoserine lactone efflux protein